MWSTSNDAIVLLIVPASVWLVFLYMLPYIRTQEFVITLFSIANVSACCWQHNHHLYAYLETTILTSSSLNYTNQTNHFSFQYSCWKIWSFFLSQRSVRFLFVASAMRCPKFTMRSFAAENIPYKWFELSDTNWVSGRPSGVVSKVQWRMTQPSQLMAVPWYNFAATPLKGFPSFSMPYKFGIINYQFDAKPGTSSVHTEKPWETSPTS